MISNSILGKILAIVLILFYFLQDKIIGIFVALIFLCFYQTDIVQNVCKTEHFQSSEIPVEAFSLSPAPFALPADELILPAFSRNNYPSPNKPQKINIQPESETVFKNQHCTPDLEFIYKKQVVKHPETIQMLFQELEFVNQKPCNPCDPTCSFSTGSNSAVPPLPLEKEERMGYSTKGKSSVEEAFEWANSWFVHKLEPFFGVGGGNTASYI